MVRQSEIGAYFLLVPGQGGCLFYTVSTEVSGGQKWELSCALGCRRAEQLDVVCYVLISAGMASACKSGEACEKGVPKPRRHRDGTYLERSEIESSMP